MLLNPRYTLTFVENSKTQQEKQKNSEVYQNLTKRRFFCFFFKKKKVFCSFRLIVFVNILFILFCKVCECFLILVIQLFSN